MQSAWVVLTDAELRELSLVVKRGGKKNERRLGSQRTYSTKKER
jgi:hypothetical protein